MFAASAWWLVPVALTSITRSEPTDTGSVGSFSLVWVAPPECPSEDEAHARFEALVAGTGREGVARVELEGQGETWTARITVDTPEGSTIRSFNGTPCPAVADAAMLVVAVTIDPFGVTRSFEAALSRTTPTSPTATPEAVDTHVLAVEGEQVPEEDEPLAADASVEPTPPVATPPPRSGRRNLGGSIWAAGGMETGTLPGVGGNLSLGGSIATGRWRFELGGLYGFGHPVAHPERAETVALVRLALGQARACWSPSLPRAVFPICLGVEGGAWIATGEGLANAQTASAPWLAFSPSAAAIWRPSPRLGVGGRVELLAPVLRGAFGTDDLDGNIVRVGRVGARVNLMIEIAFGRHSVDRNRPGRET